MTDGSGTSHKNWGDGPKGFAIGAKARFATEALQTFDHLTLTDFDHFWYSRHELVEWLRFNIPLDTE